MFLRFKPITNRIARTLGHKSSLEDAAVETVVEQDQETEHHRLPLFLPGQLEKATQSPPGHQSLVDEIKQARSTTLVHQPVVRFTIEDCLVHPAGVDFHHGSLRIQDIKKSMLSISKVHRIPEALYCMTGASHEYFGHWLQDACATALLQRGKETLILTHPSEWSHANQYLGAFGFRSSVQKMMHVDRLTIYRDFGQGSSKKLRYHEMRSRIDKFYPGNANGSKKVYFRRGATGVSRLISNEDEVIKSLEMRGFEVFDLVGATVKDIVARFRNVDCVVSIDGSHLNHLYFMMRPGSSLVTLIPSDRFTMNQIGYCAAANINYGFLVIDSVAGEYDVSINDLNSTLDMMPA